jgi:hypothetical protein
MATLIPTALPDGGAKVDYDALVAGTHSITCAYNGSATDATSTAPAISQVVDVDTTTRQHNAIPH